MKILLLFICSAPWSLTQISEPLKFFPNKAGNMWEYYWGDFINSDTLQNFNIRDSVDIAGNIYVFQAARFINPIAPPVLLSDTAVYKIDSAFNVFCLTCPQQNGFVFKLNAELGEKWIVWKYLGGGYEMARLRNIWEGELFLGSGIQTIFKEYIYYYTSDSSDTLGLVRNVSVLAKDYGLWTKGGGDAIGDIFLRGCVINGTLYGDTTNVITKAEDLSEKFSFQFELYPNFPNPFNQTTTIEFELNNSSNISIVVFDITGKVVKRLTERTLYAPGKYKIIWNGKNEFDEVLSSGVYYYQLIVNGSTFSHSMIFIK